MNTEIKQFTTVYHLEYGKGKVVTSVMRGKDELVMCFFPEVNEHDWVLKSQLENSTDEYMSLEPMAAPQDNVSDDLKDMLTSIIFGGQPPQDT